MCKHARKSLAFCWRNHELQALAASFIAAVVLAVPFAAFAQTERGTITGVVMDSSKAAVPGVSIAVINKGTNAASNVVSSDSGTYSATNLPPGTYRIEATLQGFQTSKVEGVILNAGTTARVDVTLSLGSVSESVLVVAENAVVPDGRREGCHNSVEPPDR